MFERICPKCNVPMVGDRCIKETCGSKTITSSTVYWCEKCNIPIFDKICPSCGSEGIYKATDMRPVFPEERLLIGILTDQSSPLRFMNKSVWYGSNSYVVDGTKIKVSITKANKLSLDEVRKIRNLYLENETSIDYVPFQENIEKFIEANRNRYNYIKEESFTYIHG